jgi:DNA polymerase elongation subunit (family B)
VIGPRILTLDLETVGQMDSSYGEVITYGAKWLGEPTVIIKDLRDFKLYKKEPWNSAALLSDLADLIDSADMIVTFFGTGFDLPMIKAMMTKIDRYLKPVQHVDLYYVNKYHHKLGRGSLDAALTFFEMNEQKLHLAPLVWLKAMHGNAEAMDLIKTRCESDVKATEELYLKLRPLIRTHPRLTLQLCRVCGGNNVTWKGSKITSAGVRHKQYQCQQCGAWGSVIPSNESIGR